MMIPPAAATDYTTIIIAGLGREGFSSYRYFSKRYPTASLVLSDDRPLVDLDQHWQVLIEKKLARFVPLADLATQVSAVAPTKTLLVKTAGIPIEKEGIQALLQAGATLTSNTAAFFAACSTLPVPPRTIGVTGTKGKSTTASMIYHLLKENGIPVVLTGNIGVPPLETLTDPMLEQATTQSPPVVVLELSSHQLRELTISPEIAVIQDITPEHLDYYPSFAVYLEAKAAITLFQQSQDWVVFNPQYQVPTMLAARSQAKKLCFSLEQEVLAGGVANSLLPPIKVYLKNDWLWFGTSKILAASEVPLVGQHNLLNIMPAILIALELFTLNPEGVASAVRSFVGLPHRLEYAGEKNGVQYYNDSQATTPEAAMAALASFPSKRIVLIAGGSDKGVSFEQLGVVILRSSVTDLLVFPPIGEKIVAAVQAAAVEQPDSVAPKIQEVRSMREAVELAAASAAPGSIVLLSPACASFGLFKNYQDRGDQFKAVVQSLA